MSTPTRDPDDDRVTCTECRNSDPGSYRCIPLRRSIILDQPLRCIAFTPMRRAPDQRAGCERWPNLKRDIEDARAADARPTSDLARKKR